MSTSNSLKKRQECDWIGHCLGDPCKEHNECDADWMCIEHVCSRGELLKNMGMMCGKNEECNTSCCKQGQGGLSYCGATVECAPDDAGGFVGKAIHGLSAWIPIPNQVKDSSDGNVKMSTTAVLKDSSGNVVQTSTTDTPVATLTSTSTTSTSTTSATTLALNTPLALVLSTTTTVATANELGEKASKRLAVTSSTLLTPKPTLAKGSLLRQENDNVDSLSRIDVPSGPSLSLESINTPSPTLIAADDTSTLHASPSTSQTGAIVGIVVSIVGILMMSLFILYMYRKRPSKVQSTPSTPVLEKPPVMLEPIIEKESFEQRFSVSSPKSLYHGIPIFARDTPLHTSQLFHFSIFSGVSEFENYEKD